MNARKDVLPEGTDSIVEDGAAKIADAASDIKAVATSKGQAATRKVADAAAGLRDQAADKARDLAHQGKERTANALDGVTKFVGNAAGTIDDTVGEQYGAYARRAADAIQGFSTTLRSKDVDDLLNDAREVIRKNPAIALGAAAAVGFVFARLIRAGASSPREEEAENAGAGTDAKA